MEGKATIQTENYRWAVVTEKAALQEKPECSDPFTENSEARAKSRNLFDDQPYSVPIARRINSTRAPDHHAGHHSRIEAEVHTQPTHSRSPLKTPELPELPSRTASTPVASDHLANIVKSPDLFAGDTVGQIVDFSSPTPLKTSSVMALKPMDLTKFMFEPDSQKPIPVEAFNFNSHESHVRRPKSSSSMVAPVPIKSTDVGTEFSGRENTIRQSPFTFHLSTGTSLPTRDQRRTVDFPIFSEAVLSAAVRGSSLASPSAAEDTEASHESDSITVVPATHDLLVPDPCISTQPSNAVEQVILPVQKASLSPNPKSVVKSASHGQDSVLKAGSSSRLEEPNTELPVEASSQSSGTKPSPPAVISEGIIRVPSIELSSDSSPISLSPPISEAWHPKALPDLSAQKPLPPFNFGFIPRSPNLRPRFRGSSTARTGSPSRPTEMGSDSRFLFGSGYKLPPKSFDFENWSKISSNARLSGKSSIWTEFGVDFGKILQEKPVDELDQANLRGYSNDAEDDEVIFGSGSSAETLRTASAGECGGIETPSESASKHPVTPAKNSPAVPNTGLLTPEATPEPAKSSIVVERDSDTPGLMSQPLKVQRREVAFDMGENKTIIPTAATEDYGYAVITDHQKYESSFSSDQKLSLATPPASPQPSHSSEHEGAFQPYKPQSRSSPTISRKPLANNQGLLSVGPAQDIKTNPGRSTWVVEDEFRPEQVQIKWEGKQFRFRGRGLNRNMKKTLARAAIAVKTGATKVADLSGSIATRLQPDGVDLQDQSSAR